METIIFGCQISTPGRCGTNDSHQTNPLVSGAKAVEVGTGKLIASNGRRTLLLRNPDMHRVSKAKTHYTTIYNINIYIYEYVYINMQIYKEILYIIINHICRTFLCSFSRSMLLETKLLRHHLRTARITLNSPVAFFRFFWSLRRYRPSR